jgi:hypothetical protein
MHWQDEGLDDHSVQDIGNRVGIVDVCGGCAGPETKQEVLVF